MPDLTPDNTDSERPHWESFTQLEYAAIHVFLPAQQEVAESKPSPENSYSLARAVCAAAHSYADKLDDTLKPQWRRITHMLDNLQAFLRPEQNLDKGNVISLLRGMQAGDVLAFPNEVQCGGVIFRKQDQCTRYEAFQTCLDLDSTFSRSYPEWAIEIPNETFHNVHFQSELASFLLYRDFVHQYGDSTGGYTPLLTSILRGIGRGTKVPRVTKRVLAHNSYMSRSSLWFLIKVAIQTSLDYYGIGRTCYKAFMLYFMCGLARDAISVTLSSFLLHAMSAKLLQRLRKLASSSPIWLNHMVLEIDISLREVLEARWREVEVAQCLQQLWNPSHLDLDRDSQLSLLNSHPYIQSSLASVDLQRPSSPFRPQCLLRGTFHDFLSSDRPFTKEACHIDSYVTLYDFEQTVQAEIDDWAGGVTNVDQACIQLEALIHQYLSEASHTYKGNPEDKSMMLLTVIELWVALDKLVVGAIPTLADYSPELPMTLLYGPLYRKSANFYRFCCAYHYLSTRHSQAHEGYSVFSNEFAATTFPVDPTVVLQDGLPSTVATAVFQLGCPVSLHIWRCSTARLLDSFSVDRPVANTRLRSRQAWPVFLRTWHTRTVHLLDSSFVCHSKVDSALPESPDRSVMDVLRLRPYLLECQTSAITGQVSLICSGPARAAPSLPDVKGNFAYNISHERINTTSHTSNGVLATLEKCPNDMSVHEFIAFGHMRSGGSLQWINILHELRSQTLNFRRHDVHLLLAQAASQVGPPDPDTTELVWHRELQESTFCFALLGELESLLADIGAHSLDGVTMSTISFLLTRLLAANPSGDTLEKAIELLRQVRKKTFHWVQELSYSLMMAPMDTERRRLLRDIATTCRSTFDVDYEVVHKLLYSAEDVDVLLSCAIIINTSSPIDVQNVSRDDVPNYYSGLLLQRDRRLSLTLESILRDVIQDDGSNRGIDLAVRRVWYGYRPGPYRWTSLPHPDSHWLTSVTSTARSKCSRTVHLNILSGSLLVDGRPIDGLSNEIREQPTYKRIFSNQSFLAIPSDLPGMDFCTLAMVFEHRVHFALQSGNLTIQAQYKDSGDILQLIPHEKLQGDLPTPLVHGHVHWLNLSTSIIEIRPHEKPWEQSAHNWRIHCASGKYRMQKGRSNEWLVDIRGPTWKMVSSRLECLDVLRNLVITVTLPTDRPYSSSRRRLSVALPRYGLSFFVNEGEDLESHDFKNMVYDEAQSIGTLFGLEDRLVLRQKIRTGDEFVHKCIIVPDGRISREQHNHHFCVKIDTIASITVTYYTYWVDTDLGCLIGSSTSLRSKLYLAHLHAQTSVDWKSDPLTGRTGIQEALCVLRSAGCRSIIELDTRSEEPKLLTDYNYQTYPQISFALQEIHYLFMRERYLRGEKVEPYEVRRSSHRLKRGKLFHPENVKLPLPPELDVIKAIRTSYLFPSEVAGPLPMPPTTVEHSKPWVGNDLAYTVSLTVYDWLINTEKGAESRGTTDSMDTLIRAPMWANPGLFGPSIVQVDAFLQDPTLNPGEVPREMESTMTNVNAPLHPRLWLRLLRLLRRLGLVQLRRLRELAQLGLEKLEEEEVGWMVLAFLLVLVGVIPLMLLWLELLWPCLRRLWLGRQSQRVWLRLRRLRMWMRRVWGQLCQLWPWLQRVWRQLRRHWLQLWLQLALRRLRRQSLREPQPGPTVANVDSLLQEATEARQQFRLLFLLPAIVYHQGYFAASPTLSILVAIAKQSLREGRQRSARCQPSDRRRPSRNALRKCFAVARVCQFFAPLSYKTTLPCDMDLYGSRKLNNELRELFSSCYSDVLRPKEDDAEIATKSRTPLGTAQYQSPSDDYYHTPWQITLPQLFCTRTPPDILAPSRLRCHGPPRNEALPDSDATRTLSQLFSTLQANKNDPAFQQQYISRLHDSARHVCDAARTTHKPSQAPSIKELQEYYVLCKKNFMDSLIILKTELGPKDNPVAQALDRSGQWPRITPDTLFRCLASTSLIELPDKWKQSLVSLGLLLAELQRARRLLRFAHDNLEEELCKELDNEPCDRWNAEEHADWLLIQLQGNFLIRRTQVDAAVNMIFPHNGENIAIQVNMGEGKTSVILPISAATLADGNQLVRVVVPKALTVQTFRLLVGRLGGLADRPIYHLPFSRSLTGHYEYEQLDMLHQLLLECVRKRGILVVQPEQVLSLKLITVEKYLPTHLRGHNEEFDTEKSQFRKLKCSILELESLVHSFARDILDESDEVLHPRFQLIHTIGLQQHMEGHPDRWIITQQVLKLVKIHALSLSHDLPDVIEYERSSSGSFPRFHGLRASDTSQRLIALIVDDAMTGRIPALNLRDINRDRKLRPAVRDFLSSKDVLPEIAGMVENYARKYILWPGILLLRGLLAHGILLFALTERRWRVDYGLYPKRTMLAVPYRAKDVPAPTAEFGHPDITIVLSCLSYYYGGLTEEQLMASFATLQSQDDPSMEYAGWLNDCDPHTVPDSVRDLRNVNIKSPEQWDKYLFPLFARNQGAVDFYLSQVVFPKEAKEFPWKLAASSWDLAETRERPLTGFSGTNDAQYLLPTSITQHDLDHQRGTNARVLSCLLQPENSSYAIVSYMNDKRRTTLELLRMVVNQKPEIRVLLDVGAQILDLRNHQLAKEWLELNSDADGAVFFNEDDELEVVTRDGNCRPLISSPFFQRLDRCVVYLDDAHTRGTDLKLPVGFRAAVTLGPKITKDRLVQGCMRMRKLGHGHSVMFFAPPEVDRDIRATTGETNQLTTTNILHWAIHGTWSDIRQRAPYWAQQGINHKTRYDAWARFRNYEITRKEFTDAWVQPEVKSLVDLYAPFRPRNVTNRSSILGEHLEIQQRCKDLGVLRLPERQLDEEQEREVNREIEQEKEPVDRQTSDAAPAEHSLHPDVVAFVKTGVIPRFPVFRRAFHPAFETLKKSTATTNEADVWSPLILATTDFCKTARSSSYKGKRDRFLRPVQWVLSGKWGADRVLILLSPFEADRLMPDIRVSKFVHLHVYTPRTSARMRPADDLKLYSIPPVPDSWEPPWDLIDQLNIFAGQLFLRDYESYLRVCRLFGVHANEPQCLVGLAVRPRFFNPSGPTKPGTMFKASPLPFVRALLLIRRRGLPISETHMGRILQGQRLLEEDFLPRAESGYSPTTREKMQVVPPVITEHTSRIVQKHGPSESEKERGQLPLVESTHNSTAREGQTPSTVKPTTMFMDRIVQGQGQSEKDFECPLWARSGHANSACETQTPPTDMLATSGDDSPGLTAHPPPSKRGRKAIDFVKRKLRPKQQQAGQE